MKKVTLDYVRPFFENGGHGLDHVKRVYRNALMIAETEECDIEVVKAMVLLHDPVSSSIVSNTS